MVSQLTQTPKSLAESIDSGVQVGYEKVAKQKWDLNVVGSSCTFSKFLVRYRLELVRRRLYPSSSSVSLLFLPLFLGRRTPEFSQKSHAFTTTLPKKKNPSEPLLPLAYPHGSILLDFHPKKKGKQNSRKLLSKVHFLFF